MSDEQPQDKKPEAIVEVVGRGGTGETVNLQFADGWHTVPAHVVAHLGGADELTSKAATWRQFTFAEFMQEFSAQVAGASLRRFQAQFIHTSLSRFR